MDKKHKCQHCRRRLMVPHRNGFPEHFCLLDGHGMSHKEVMTDWCPRWARDVKLAEGEN